MAHELTRIHTGLDFGEGPRWHDGVLWFSDFYRQGVFTIDADGHEHRVVTVEGQPSGLGWLPNGDLLIVSMTDQRLLRFDGTDLHDHADLSEFATGNCNDMVVAADGTAYVGNFGFDLESGAAPAPTNLIHVTPDGEVFVGADDVVFPNGMVITPDGSTLIVGETFGHRYTAFTIEDDGGLTDRRMWADLNGAYPDGCCLDAEEAIWFADPAANCVRRVVHGGQITDEIPTERTAVACMLGGEDRRTLYVLSSSGTHPDQVAGAGTGVIETTTVDVPGVGLP